MKITINAAQGAALVWTIIAVAITLIVVLPSGLTQTIFGSVAADYFAYWYLVVIAFFAVFLIVTLPVYLFIALWELAKDPEDAPEPIPEPEPTGQDKEEETTETKPTVTET